MKKNTKTLVLLGAVAPLLLLSASAQTNSGRPAAPKLREEEFNSRLDKQWQLLNLTSEQWNAQNNDQATIPPILERELNIKVTDADAKKFYDEHTATFEQPEMVRAAHVLIGTRNPL